jgi:hypothetical protein
MLPRADVFMKRRADESLLETDDLGRLIHWITATKEPELLARDIEVQATTFDAIFA